jgi:hypothetical protein
MPRTTNTSRTSGTSRRSQEVPDAAGTPAARRRTDAEDRLWVALYDQPGSSAAQLALVAGIGKSTAGKILAAWAKDATVTRTSGEAQGGRRVADRWTITEPHDQPAPTAEDTDQSTHTESTAELVPECSDVGSDTGGNENSDTAVTGEQLADPATPPTAGSATAATSTGEAITVSAAEYPAGPADQPGPPSTEDGSECVPAAPAVGASDMAGSEVPVKAPRLGKGALRGMVEDFLTEHQGEQFSPNKIGKELGRSAGAVFNALEKLVAAGWAVRTSDAPKRYTAKSGTDAPAGGDTATDVAAPDARPEAAHKVG